VEKCIIAREVTDDGTEKMRFALRISKARIQARARAHTHAHTHTQ